MTAAGYQKPSRLTTAFYRIVNPLIRFLVFRFNFQRDGEQDALRILRVRGRKSGKLYETPVRVATFEGGRYIVASTGESQWVRNLRTSGSADFLVGTTVEPILAHELQDREKIRFWTWYCQQPMYATRVRYGLGTNTKQLMPEGLERLARRYPVFRIGTNSVMR